MNFTVKVHTNLKNTKLRLAREYGWSQDFIDLGVNEYIKFLILHQKYPTGKIVPGKVVDKIWHDHILHTREYYEFCKEHFGSYLHHDPKNLVSNEVNDLSDTMSKYEDTFGYKPPAMFWLDDIKICNQLKTNIKETPAKTTTASCCRCG
jgi:hypothetical protein